MDGQEPSEPEAPENVRLEVDDQVFPLEVYYEGQDADGMHVWVATTDLTHVLRAGASRVRGRVDKMPPRTTIRLTG